MSGYATTDKERNADGSFTISELNRRAAIARDAAPMVTRCAHCPWAYDGPAGQARYEWEQHIAAEHPNVRLTKSRHSQKTSSEVDRDEALVLVEQRAAVAAASETREESEVEQHADPVPFGDCKIEGCTEPAAAKAGPYAKLCLGHRAESVARRGQVQARQVSEAPPPVASSNGHKPDRLSDLAQQLGAAIIDLQRLTEEREAARARVRQLASEAASA